MAKARRSGPLPPPPESVNVSVKVPRTLASLLDQLPNRSEFIRAAIEARLDETCPTCLGTGRVDRATRQELLQRLAGR